MLDARRYSNSKCLFLVCSSTHLPLHDLQSQDTVFLIFVDIIMYICFFLQKYLMKIYENL